MVDFLNSARGLAGDELESLIAANAPLVLTGLIVAEVLRGLKRDVEPVTELLARWPLIEPGGFATYEAAATIFRQARGRGVTLSKVVASLFSEAKADLRAVEIRPDVHTSFTKPILGRENAC